MIEKQREVDTGQPGKTVTSWLAGTWKACGQLSAGMLIALALMGFLAHRSSGTEAMLASFMAGMLCWLGAILALLITSRTHGATQAVAGMLLSMACRLGFVLIAFLVLKQWSDKIGQSNLVFHLLAYYALALVLETVLVVNLIRQAESTPGVS